MYFQNLLLGQDSVGVGVYVGVGERVYYCFFNMKFPELIVGRKTPNSRNLVGRLWKIEKESFKPSHLRSSVPFLFPPFLVYLLSLHKRKNTTDFCP